MAHATIDFEVPRWRVVVACAVIRAACVVALVSPQAAIAIGERAASWAVRGVRLVH